MTEFVVQLLIISEGSDEQRVQFFFYGLLRGSVYVIALITVRPTGIYRKPCGRRAEIYIFYPRPLSVTVILRFCRVSQPDKLFSLAKPGTLTIVEIQEEGRKSIHF